MGGLCPMAGGTAGQSRTDNDWFRRAGRPDRANDPRFGSGYGSRNKIFTLWPLSARMIGDTSVDFGMFGRDVAGGADFYQAWSPWQRPMRGNGSTKFIMGTCYDSLGNAVPGAVVQGFVTATDAFVTETQCDDKGNYELATTFPGTQHYLVAYRAGSPAIAGTTVNTLTPTNRDGT